MKRGTSQNNPICQKVPNGRSHDSENSKKLKSWKRMSFDRHESIDLADQSSTNTQKVP